MGVAQWTGGIPRLTADAASHNTQKLIKLKQHKAHADCVHQRPDNLWYDLWSEARVRLQRRQVTVGWEGGWRVG